MLTLLTIPKPFCGHIAVIQRNAIQSWTLLQPRPEVIVFGDDEGVADIAKEFSVRHVAEVARNEYGTPLLNDLFEKAQSLVTHGLLCYVNADIILMTDFMEAVKRVVRHKRRCLMVGQRWDMDIKESLDFSPGWEERLRTAVMEQGTLHRETGIDYFVSPLGLLSDIPPFAIGRTAWDNWLVYRARSQLVPVIDATQVVMAIHQSHDYSYHSSEKEGVWNGPEAKRNWSLAGDGRYIFTLQDATHLLTANGLKWALDGQRMWRHLHTLPVLYPYLRLPVRLLRKAIIVSHPLRARLGLTLSKGDPRHG